MLKPRGIESIKDLIPIPPVPAINPKKATTGIITDANKNAYQL